MSDLEQLLTEYEQADAEAIRLSGEYSQRYQDGVRELREQLRAEYGDQLEAATEQAAEAQRTLLDTQAALELLDRDDAESVLGSLDRDVGFDTEGSRRLRERYEALRAERDAN